MGWASSSARVWELELGEVEGAPVAGGTMAMNAAKGDADGEPTELALAAEGSCCLIRGWAWTSAEG